MARADAKVEVADVRRTAEQRRLAVVDKASVLKNGDFVGDGCGFGKAVGGDQDGGSLLAEGADKLPELFGGAGVKAAGRLV